jgi:hypothetical protein
VVQFAEYQLFAESTQYLSERRQTVAQIYLGVASAIFGVLSFLGERFGFGTWSLVLASAPLVAAGALVAFIWQRAIEENRALIAWRFERLIEIESELPGSFRIYTKEKAAFYAGASPGGAGHALGLLGARARAAVLLPSWLRPLRSCDHRIGCSRTQQPGGVTLLLCTVWIKARLVSERHLFGEIRAR